MNIRFATIDWLPGYKFGDNGSVWSCWTRSAKKGLPKGGGTVSVVGETWKELVVLNSSNGYKSVRIKKGNKIIHIRVHRLILEAFVGPRPDKQGCRHINGNPSNNALSNLCWGTQQENIGDTMRHGRIPKGDNHWSRRSKTLPSTDTKPKDPPR